VLLEVAGEGEVGAAGITALILTRYFQ